MCVPDHENFHMNETFADPNEKCTRETEKESPGETACCYRILERSWGWNEVEIGKLPINTNHQTIQYPCEILWQEGRRKSKGLETKVAQSAPSTAGFHAFKEIALFKRFPSYMSIDASIYKMFLIIFYHLENYQF